MIQKLQTGLNKYGSSGLIRQFFRHKFPLFTSLVFQKSDLNQTIHNIYKPPGLVIERYSTLNKIPFNVLSALTLSSSSQMNLEVEVTQRFSKGCEMWLGHFDGSFAGICWSRSRVARDDYFLPLDRQDAVFSSCFVLPSSRGKGVFPYMLQSIFKTLSNYEQIDKAYIDCKSWNLASVRGIEKAGFVFIGKAIRLVIDDRIFILRNTCKKER
jgi:RimJ/RimL family protein N-acetyltransferase